jgi:hypothetical protein
MPPVISSGVNGFFMGFLMEFYGISSNFSSDMGFGFHGM